MFNHRLGRRTNLAQSRTIYRRRKDYLLYSTGERRVSMRRRDQKWIHARHAERTIRGTGGMVPRRIPKARIFTRRWCGPREVRGVATRHVLGVGRVHAGRPDLDGDLARARCRDVVVLEREDVDVTRTGRYPVLRHSSNVAERSMPS